MDTRYSRPEADASHSSDITTAPHDVGDPRRLVIQGTDPRMAAASQAVLPGIAKDTIAGPPQEDASAENGMMRESWVSFASTAASRDSGVPSIFSVRASTASAATRYSIRQSSIESPISATSPMHQGHRKSSYPQGPRYCCTFCDEAFDSNTEWKLHEFEFHDRRERYHCRNCPAVFSRAALFSEHLKTDHGLAVAEGTTGPVEHAPIRSAWGCGFCAAFISSRTDYLDHVGEHYDEGKEMAEWQHTRVIEGLLHQPKVASAWMALVAKEEHARSAKLRFLWDPHTTGRSADEREPQRLQDMLELFPTGAMEAAEAATRAYSSAHIRTEGNVSDLINKLYLRHPNPKPSQSNPNLAERSPELQPTAPRVGDDLVSPMSPLPAPLRPPTAPPRISGPLPPPSRFLTQSPTLSSAPSVSASVEVGLPALPRPFKPSSLRRIESSRSLGLSKIAGTVNSLDRQGITMLPPMGSFDVPPISIRGTAEPLLRALETPERPFSAGAQRPTLSPMGLNATSSVKPHTSSSTLSTHTRDGSHGFGDSNSEIVSDDSLSEPDSWLDSGGVPAATKIWRDSFQQAVDRGMRQLWLQYNHDWDALVRQCVGETANDSMQYRESSGRVRKGAPSRYAPSKGLRPNGRSFGQEDEDEDEEREGHQPPPSSSKRSPEVVKRFACPFRKHDPVTYNIQDHEVCAIRSWSTISRLKEHLYRRHYKIHCQRCKRIFSDARELAEHEMLAMGCEVLDVIPPGDITTYQEKQLKSRKHTTRRQTDEEKWRDIYRLLFPSEEIPSPYPEAAEDMGPTTAESQVSFNFQHFLLSEMPTLFTRTAEEHAGRHLQAHEGLALEVIPGIIQEALQKAFRAWEARGSALPTREASVASASFLPETPTSLAYSFGQPTAYQTPQPTATLDHSFPQGHFNNPDFACEVPHASHADDSGFAEDSFFTSGPPVNFNTFAPEYERGPWEPGLGLMDVGSLEHDLNLGGHFRGFQRG